MPPKKRFIAGASCPACRATDTIFVLSDGNDVSRHCVECDFSEGLEPVLEPVLETVLETGNHSPADEERAVVRIIDP